MTTLQQLLDRKGREVWSIDPDASVFDAIQTMADRDAGALVVLEDGRLVGIITERHYARNVFLKGKSSPKTPVREVMEARVVCAPPEQTVEEAMAVMTEKRVRHLPVMEADRLIGIVSIGDLVSHIIADQKFTIEQLEHYIHG